MKKILLIGNCPLPQENVKVRPAAGLRTYQFLKALAGGFEVKLVTIAMPECYGNGGGEGDDGGVDAGMQNARTSATLRSTLRSTISKDDPNLLRTIQKIHDEFQPDAIIAVNTHPCSVACRLTSRAPVWADLNGWIMSEAQAQAYKMESNDYLSHYFEMERAVVMRADKFSTVSEPQTFALLGELAFCGRLCGESFGYHFVESIANGTEDFEGEGKGGAVSSDVSGLRDIPKNAFVLLWAGGYNTWVDEITLFKGVSAAMEACEKLYFVSTGGEISGLDNKTFAKFKSLIDESAHRDRFVFLGWVETAAMPDLYSRADCGINVDRNCVETLTGARNRINEMMKFGLPIVTTLGSEISYAAVAAGGGIGVKSGDHEGLAGAIIEMYEEWRGGGELASRKFRGYGKAGRDYIVESCNYEILMRPLLKWLENPRPAPDRGVRTGGFGRGVGGRGGRWHGGGYGGGFLSLLSPSRSAARARMFWRYLKENGFKKSFKKFLQKIRE